MCTDAACKIPPITNKPAPITILYFLPKSSEKTAKKTETTTVCETEHNVQSNHNGCVSEQVQVTEDAGLWRCWVMEVLDYGSV